MACRVGLQDASESDSTTHFVALDANMSDTTAHFEVQNVRMSFSTMHLASQYARMSDSTTHFDNIGFEALKLGCAPYLRHTCRLGRHALELSWPFG